MSQGHICFSISLYPPKQPEREGITFLFRMKMMIFKEVGTLLEVKQLAGMTSGLELTQLFLGAASLLWGQEGK